MRSRIESTWPWALVAFRSGTSGGGGGGGVPSRFSRIHLPRTTGEVRCGYEVVARIAPLPSRPRVGQHAPDLLFEHRRLAQLSTARRVQQFVVWNAAPEEERQPRRQLELADRIGGVGGDPHRVSFNTKQKFRAHEQTLNGEL